MKLIRSSFAAAAVVILTTAVPASSSGAQAPSPALHLLDVPYLPQSEALCGGAAVAMVMRYWGATGVYAETFADLVDREAGGIRGEDLIRSLQGRRWDARSFAGDPAFVQSHLSAGRPVIALIEDRPGRFHYVVLVGWAGGRVILHDPARAPYRVLDEAAFMERWRVSGSWGLLALPGASAPVKAEPRRDDVASVTRRSAEPCAGLVEEGVRLASTGETSAARDAFEAAADACPASSAPPRELAGLNALQSRWRDAAVYAREAVTRDDRDEHAWRILATSLYLLDDVDGALDAWNHTGEPTIDLVNVTGLDRIRQQVAAQAIGLEPQTVLTPAALRAARRRLAELPAASTTRVAYRPREDGRAVVDAVVLERPMLPTSRAALVAAGVRAASDRELTVNVATPTGGGELWTASWRWWERRPRVSLAFATPSPVGGTWRIEAFSERQTYAEGSGELRERRRGGSFAASDWTRGGLRWEAALGVDRWDSAATSATLTVALEQRFAADRVAVSGHTAATGGDVRAAGAGIAGAWRSATHHEGTVWLARAGGEAVRSGSPLAFWPGAGAGQGRGVLLRAHPLLEDGRIRGVFGRRLVHAGAEWRQWLKPAAHVIRFGPAIFVDSARAWAGLASSDARWHVDAGAGLRIAAPGSGVIRIDVARGLRDGNTTLSLGWTR